MLKIDVSPMKSKVFFVDLKVRRDCENTIQKIKRLYDTAGFDRIIDEGDFTAIKMHFGEKGNEGFISPVNVRQVVDKIHSSGAKAYLTDTNTLYSGYRHNAVDHLTTAIEHGFGYEVTRAPLIIADGLLGNGFRQIPIKGRHFDSVKIASELLDCQSMIVMSHFKGHELAGFGGAIKNLAMGGGSVAGKMEQHKGLHPEIDAKRCNGCATCVEVCPCDAMEINSDNISTIDDDKCIGCGECMTVCPVEAIDFNYADIPDFMEMITEYALGTVAGRQEKIGYMNFLVRITPDCDCVPWSDVSLVPDIGILASTDPVAIDQASLDLVNEQQGFTASKLEENIEPGKDKFKGVWKNSAGDIQLSYGEEIGLGNRDYELIRI